MPELSYPSTQIMGLFPGEARVSVFLHVDHDGDSVADADVIDAVKDALTTAGALVVDAVTSSVVNTPA